MQPPLQGFVIFDRNTQGGARSSLALGWHVAGPLALRTTSVQSAVQALNLRALHAWDHLSA